MFKISTNMSEDYSAIMAKHDHPKVDFFSEARITIWIVGFRNLLKYTIKKKAKLPLHMVYKSTLIGLLFTKNDIYNNSIYKM